MNNELTIKNTEVTLVDIRMDKVRFPRLCQYSQEEASLLMRQIVVDAMDYRGQRIEKEQVCSIAVNLTMELKRDEYGIGTKYITFEEIARAVKKAVLTTESFYVSVASLYKVVMDYIKGEGHQVSLEADERRKREEMARLKGSAVFPMIQAYTGALTKNIKQ